MIQPGREHDIKCSASHARPRLALAGCSSSLKHTGSLKIAAGDAPGPERGFTPNSLGHDQGDRELDFANVCDEN